MCPHIEVEETYEIVRKVKHKKSYGKLITVYDVYIVLCCKDCHKALCKYKHKSNLHTDTIRIIFPDSKIVNY